MRSILITFSDNCEYFSVTLCQNSTSGRFWKKSHNMKFETVSINLRLGYLKMHCSLLYFHWHIIFVAFCIGHLESYQFPALGRSLKYWHILSYNIRKPHWWLSLLSHDIFNSHGYFKLMVVEDASLENANFLLKTQVPLLATYTISCFFSSDRIILLVFERISAK